MGKVSPRLPLEFEQRARRQGFRPELLVITPKGRAGRVGVASVRISSDVELSRNLQSVRPSRVLAIEWAYRNLMAGLGLNPSLILSIGVLEAKRLPKSPKTFDGSI